MILDRREVLVVGAAGAVVAVMPAGAFAQDAAKTADDWIAEFTGGAEVTDSDAVKLDAPEIAENGNTVPVAVDAPGASEVLVLAPGNPAPGVAIFKFGALAGSQAASTRIRLAQTQDIVAIAKLADGSFARASSNVKVTIGGCGG